MKFFILLLVVLSILFVASLGVAIKNAPVSVKINKTESVSAPTQHSCKLKYTTCLNCGTKQKRIVSNKDGKPQVIYSCNCELTEEEGLKLRVKTLEEKVEELESK